jgi:uncharacterized RDD family membrane protein YckC
MNQENVDIKTPEYVSIQFKLAGLGSRAAALIIDQLILLVANVLIFVILYFVTKDVPYIPFWHQLESLPLAIAIIAIFVINWGYFFVLEFFSGGKTVGKRAMGIRVIQENGHSITLLSSFIRNLLRIIDSLPASNLLGMLMIFFHSKHKRIGDIVAGTIVVHERKAKRNKKLTAIEREIEKRGLSKESLIIEEWTLKSFEKKEWNLVKTYTNRFLQLPVSERKELTRHIATILFPKLGVEIDKKNDNELENTLLTLYLILKDEWEYEL